MLMVAVTETVGEQIAAEAKRVRVALGRSSLLNQLFDFLTDRSIAGDAPKEIEIAQEVFGKSTDFDMSQDASVRVYVHRLRRKIDDFYADSTGPRLFIPKGEYRLAILEEEDQPAPPEEDAPPPPPFEKPRRVSRRMLWLAAAMLVFVNLLIWLAVVGSRPSDPNRALAKAFFWNGLTAGARPTFVVAGDYYLFGDAPDEMEVTRLVREFSINSRADLDNYLMDHPDERGRLVDVNLHYLPTSTARALSDVLPVVNAAATLPSAATPWALTTSELTPDTLKGVNIVYVGFLSGLGILRDPVFEASGFDVGASYDELVDRASGKHFVSDWSAVIDNREQHRDYAYLASLPGAAGNRMLIVAGTRDAGVMQAAEIARDKKQLDQIAKRVGDQSAFEALYEVRTLGNVNLGSTLILARALRGNPGRATGRADQVFPDQSPAGDARGRSASGQNMGSKSP